MTKLITNYGISIMTKLHTNKMTSRRAVAPVIATLLLVAIAVVGGSIIFVFSQGFFSSAQISGSPNIESIKILGYDATDGDDMIFHDGITSSEPMLTGETNSDGLLLSDYVGVYLKNDSVNKITVGELRIAGNIYTYVDMEGDPLPVANGTKLHNGTYTIVEEGGAQGTTINSSAPSLEPGQQATLVFSLEKDVKVGRDLQFKLQTAAGSVFVGTINTGQQSG
jgi:flagellin-like protein